LSCGRRGGDTTKRGRLTEVKKISLLEKTRKEGFDPGDKSRGKKKRVTLRRQRKKRVDFCVALGAYKVEVILRKQNTGFVLRDNGKKNAKVSPTTVNGGGGRGTSR